MFANIFSRKNDFSDSSNERCRKNHRVAKRIIPVENINHVEYKTIHRYCRFAQRW